MKNLLKKLFKKECKHGFDVLEVANLKLDPACKKCGKKLSEAEKELTN